MSRRVGKMRFSFQVAPGPGEHARPQGLVRRQEREDLWEDVAGKRAEPVREGDHRSRRREGFFLLLAASRERRHRIDRSPSWEALRTSINDDKT